MIPWDKQRENPGHRSGRASGPITGGGAARGHPIEMIARGRQTLDITNPEAIAACMHEARPDLVINATAYTAVDKAKSEPDVAHLVNVVGAGNLAYAAQAAGIPIIQLSTDDVFDCDKGSKARRHTARGT